MATNVILKPRALRHSLPAKSNNSFSPLQDGQKCLWNVKC